MISKSSEDGESQLTETLLKAGETGSAEINRYLKQLIVSYVTSGGTESYITLLREIDTEIAKSSQPTQNTIGSLLLQDNINNVNEFYKQAKKALHQIKMSDNTLTLRRIREEVIFELLHYVYTQTPDDNGRYQDILNAAWKYGSDKDRKNLEAAGKLPGTPNQSRQTANLAASFLGSYFQEAKGIIEKGTWMSTNRQTSPDKSDTDKNLENQRKLSEEYATAHPKKTNIYKDAIKPLSNYFNFFERISLFSKTEIAGITHLIENADSVEKIQKLNLQDLFKVANYLESMQDITHAIQLSLCFTENQAKTTSLERATIYRQLQVIVNSLIFHEENLAQVMLERINSIDRNVLFNLSTRSLDKKHICETRADVVNMHKKLAQSKNNKFSAELAEYVRNKMHSATELDIIKSLAYIGKAGTYNQKKAIYNFVPETVNLSEISAWLRRKLAENKIDFPKDQQDIIEQFIVANRSLFQSEQDKIEKTITINPNEFSSLCQLINTIEKYEANSADEKWSFYRALNSAMQKKYLFTSRDELQNLCKLIEEYEAKSFYQHGNRKKLARIINLLDNKEDMLTLHEVYKTISTDGAALLNTLIEQRNKTTDPPGFLIEDIGTLQEVASMIMAFEHHPNYIKLFEDALIKFSPVSPSQMGDLLLLNPAKDSDYAFMTPNLLRQCLDEATSHEDYLIGIKKANKLAKKMLLIKVLSSALTMDTINEVMGTEPGKKLKDTLKAINVKLSESCMQYVGRFLAKADEGGLIALSDPTQHDKIKNLTTNTIDFVNAVNDVIGLSSIYPDDDNAIREYFVKMMDSMQQIKAALGDDKKSAHHIQSTVALILNESGRLDNDSDLSAQQRAWQSSLIHLLTQVSHQNASSMENHDAAIELFDNLTQLTREVKDALSSLDSTGGSIEPKNSTSLRSNKELNTTLPAFITKSLAAVQQPGPAFKQSVQDLSQFRASFALRKLILVFCISLIKFSNRHHASESKRQLLLELTHKLHNLENEASDRAKIQASALLKPNKSAPLPDLTDDTTKPKQYNPGFHRQNKSDNVIPRSSENDSSQLSKLPNEIGRGPKKA